MWKALATVLVAISLLGSCQQGAIDELEAQVTRLRAGKRAAAFGIEDEHDRVNDLVAERDALTKSRHRQDLAEREGSVRRNGAVTGRVLGRRRGSDRSWDRRPRGAHSS
jgi:hypothetical protein